MILFCFSAPLVFPAPSFSSEEIPLETIVVTDTRTARPLAEATQDIVVVTQEDIAGLPARDLGEVLSYVPGIDIAPSRGFGHGSSVTIRGSDSRHVRLMIDGIPLNNQASGQADLSRIPLENIERIEVIRGPCSSVWGSALGGVVNVITKDTGRTPVPHGNVTTSFAEFRTQRHSADAAGAGGSLGYYLSSSYRESGGRGPRDDVLEKNGFGKVTFDADPQTRWTASFGYSGAETNSGIYPDGSWLVQPTRSRYGRIGLQRDDDAGSLRAEAKYAGQNIVTDMFLAAGDTVPLATVRTEDQMYQMSVARTTTVRREDRLVFGADVEWHRLASSYLSADKALVLGAPYVNYAFNEAPWGADAGLRYDYNSAYGHEWSPSLGVLYRFEKAPDSFVRFHAARAFSAPPLLWKHYDLLLSGLTTNPDIHAERAWVYELGAGTRPVAPLKLELTLYRADVSQAINLAVNGTGDYYMKNFEKFRRQGVELRARLDVAAELSLTLAGAFNDVEDRATGATVRGGGKPRQSYSLDLDYHNP
ncbi:MAG: TonB-dependent receptor plug domain-containing protein, partial [Deltaproteobacteria bacterium]